MADNTNKNANQNQGQRTQQGDMTKPQKQGGTDDKQVSNTDVGQQGSNKSPNKGPNQNKMAPDTDTQRTPSAAPQGGKLGTGQTNQDAKVDQGQDFDNRSTQRTPRPGIDRDGQK